MAQQTAMQQLWDWIDANYHEDNFNLNDAREMSLKLEKEQIMKAVYDSMGTNFDPNWGRAEQYYNETFKGGNK